MAETPKEVHVEVFAEPVPVAVIRPAVKPEDVIAKFLIGAPMTFLLGWILMLIAGAVTDWGLSYWNTVLALIGIRLVQVKPSAQWWSHKAKGSTL